MKKLIAFLLAFLFIYSCSKDKSDKLDADLSITGKFVAPNGIDPISKAEVILFKDNSTLKETTTNSEGKFTLGNLTSGDYEVKISKGLFSTSLNIALDDIDINLNNITITDLPNIAVVTGRYDNIEYILFNLGFTNPVTQEPLFDIIEGEDITNRINENSHGYEEITSRRISNPLLEPNTSFDFGELIESPELLNSYDIIFLNCGLDESKTSFNNNLTDYVAEGGLIYSTDYAFVYLNEFNYLGFQHPYYQGDSLSTEAEIINDDLFDWLDMNFDITISDNSTVVLDQFSINWQAVNYYDEQKVTPWLYGPIVYNGNQYNRYLAYTFEYGDGAVLYSSFHTKNDPNQSEAVAKSIQYLVFELSDLKQD